MYIPLNFTDMSPYHRKKPKEKKETVSLTSLLANGTLEDALKEEPMDEPEEPFGGGGMIL